MNHEHSRHRPSQAQNNAACRSAEAAGGRRPELEDERSGEATLDEEQPGHEKNGNAIYHWDEILRPCGIYDCIYIYIYVCVYVYICVSVCMHVCMDACLRGCMHACMPACLRACMYVCINVSR